MVVVTNDWCITGKGMSIEYCSEKNFFKIIEKHRTLLPFRIGFLEKQCKKKTGLEVTNGLASIKNILNRSFRKSLVLSQMSHNVFLAVFFQSPFGRLCYPWQKIL